MRAASAEYRLSVGARRLTCYERARIWQKPIDVYSLDTSQGGDAGYHCEHVTVAAVAGAADSANYDLIDDQRDTGGD